MKTSNFYLTCIAAGIGMISQVVPARASGNAAAEERAKALEEEQRRAREAADAAVEEMDKRFKEISDATMKEIADHAKQSTATQAGALKGPVPKELAEQAISAAVKTPNDEARIKEFEGNTSSQTAVAERIIAERAYPPNSPELSLFLANRTRFDGVEGAAVAAEFRQAPVQKDAEYEPGSPQAILQNQINFGDKIPARLDGFRRANAGDAEFRAMSAEDRDRFSNLPESVRSGLSIFWARLEDYRDNEKDTNIPKTVGLPPGGVDGMWDKFIEFGNNVDDASTAASAMAPNKRDDFMRLSRNMQIRAAADIHTIYYKAQPQPPLPKVPDPAPSNQ